MKTRLVLTRIFALFLSLALAWPSTGLALRDLEPLESQQKLSGLEEALGGSRTVSPATAGLEEIASQQAYLRWTKAQTLGQLLWMDDPLGLSAILAEHMAAAGQLDEALQLALSISEGRERAIALAAIAEAISKQKQDPDSLFEEALSTARTLGGFEQTLTLAEVAWRMERTGRNALPLFQEAITAVEKGIHTDNFKARLIALIAGYLAKAGRLAEASALVKERISDFYSQAIILATIADQLTEAQQEAAPLLQQAVTIAQSISADARQSDALVEVAYSLARAGRIGEALEINSTLYWTRKELTSTATIKYLAMAGRVDEALKQATPYAISSWIEPAWSQIAIGLAQRGRFDEAIQIARSMPYRWDVWYKIAHALAKAGQLSEAVKLARQSIPEGNFQSHLLDEVTAEAARSWASAPGPVPYSRKQIQEKSPGLLEQMEARTQLYLALTFPEKSDQLHHELVRLQNEGLIAPQQYNQCMAALTLALRQSGILPTAYGEIQIKWLGYLDGMGAGVPGLQPLRLMPDSAPTRYAPIAGVIPSHLVHAGGAEYPMAFRNLWVFDEQHRKLFRINGRRFIGLGMAMDGSVALYADEETGALCSMCINRQRTQETYADDIVGILQTVYADAENASTGTGVFAVQEVLEELRAAAQIQAVLELANEWIQTLPAADRELLLNAPIRPERLWLARKTDYLELVRSKIQELQARAPKIAQEYFSSEFDGEKEVTYVKSLGVFFTDTGLKWLAELLRFRFDRTNPHQVLWELGMRQLLYQSNLVLNPDPIIRTLHALEGGLGLDFHDPLASHREALKNKIAPDLAAREVKPDQNYRLEVWVDGHSIPLQQDQLGTSLIAFLQQHLPAALKQGLYIWNQFIPAPLLSEYVVLPGDAYGLQSQSAGTPQEQARRIQQRLAEGGAEVPELPAAGLEESSGTPTREELEALVQRDMAVIANKLQQRLQEQRSLVDLQMLGIGPQALNEHGPEIAQFLKRLSAATPVLNLFVILIGKNASSYEEQSGFLMGRETAEAAAEILRKWSGHLEYFSTEEEARQLNQALLEWKNSLSITRQPTDTLPSMLQRILTIIAGLPSGLSQTEVEAFYGINLSHAYPICSAVW